MMPKTFLGTFTEEKSKMDSVKADAHRCYFEVLFIGQAVIWIPIKQIHAQLSREL